MLHFGRLKLLESSSQRRHYPITSTLMKVTTRYAYIVFVLLFIGLADITFQRNSPAFRGVMWSDSEGYYMYLPALFILKDLHAVPEGSMNARRNDKEEIVIKYTCGNAMFYLPFFAAAYGYNVWTGVNPEEYFHPNYGKAIAICGLFFGLSGLFIVFVVLSKRYSPHISWLVVFSVLFGTNFFHYLTKETGMSHVYSFFLFACVAWLIPKFYERPGFRNALLLGSALGWITLIRPTNILILLFILLYDVYSWNALRVRADFLRAHWRKLCAASLAAFLFFIPQMWYWHEMTGSWMRYSYEGESFIYWDRPKILAVLADVQNGLLLYSPIVLFALVGIVFGWRQKAHQAPGLSLVFIATTYVFASWWAWWFGGAFGHRSYVEYYAILSFGMAGFYQTVFRSRSWLLRTSIFFMALFLMFYGTKMSLLYNELPGPWDGPDWRWNWEKIRWIWSHLFD